jgi:cell division protein YceG involved in septum cleavage
MISFSGHKSDISDKEIMHRAQALGMVMPDQKKTDSIPKGTESLSTQETERDTKTKPQKQPQTEKSSQASSAQTKPEASSQTSTASPSVSSTPTTPTAPVPITVAPGESSNAVADKLFAASLINDAGEFNKYLVEHKFDSAIQPGTFSIPTGTTYEEISKILTGK